MLDSNLSSLEWPRLCMCPPQASDYTPDRRPPLPGTLHAARPVDLTAYNALAADPVARGGLLAGVLELPDVKACLAKLRAGKRVTTPKAIVYPILMLMVLPKEQVCPAVHATGAAH